MKLQRLKSSMPTLRIGPSVRELPVATTDPNSWRYGLTTAAQRGYGSKWQRARAAYLGKAANVLCRHCQHRNLLTLATDLDHVVPHRGDMKLFWDSANWQPLCKPCHDLKTKLGQ